MSDCCCGSDQPVRLIYSCSGAANTGYLADQVSRRLMKEKAGKMTCLAALGADLAGFIESAKAAGMNAVIDGCPVACGQKTFSRLGLPCTHFILTDFGVEKGKTEITAEVIADIADRVAKGIAEGSSATPGPGGSGSCCNG